MKEITATPNNVLKKKKDKADGGEGQGRGC